MNQSLAASILENDEAQEVAAKDDDENDKPKKSSKKKKVLSKEVLEDDRFSAMFQREVWLVICHQEYWITNVIWI